MSSQLSRPRRVALTVAATVVGTLGVALGGMQSASAITGPAPANDNFAAASALTGASGGLYDGDTTAATAQASEPAAVSGHPATGSIWYRWTPSRSGKVTFTTEHTNFDTVLAAYRGTNLTNLVKVAANDDATIDGVASHQSTITFVATAGVVYRIQLDGYSEFTRGQSLLSWTSNDNFADAALLHGNSTTTAGGDVGATSEPSEPSHAGVIGGHSVWYQWTPTATGAAGITVTGDSTDTLLAVYEGSSVSSLTKVAANDDVSDTNSDSGVSFAAVAVAGKTYRIAVDAVAASGPGSFMLSTNLVPNPIVSVVGASSAEGNTGTHTAFATLKLRYPSTSTVLASWTTKNGTATAGTDYAAASGMVNFAPGQTTKTVSVTVYGDTTKEPNETIVLDITLLGAGAQQGMNSPIIIKNDD